MYHSFTVSLVVLVILPYIRAACDCEAIDSFANLKELLENPSSKEGDLVRLCPFHVIKYNSEEGIKLSKGMHVMCAKDSREDECKIEGFGVAASYNVALEVFSATTGVDNIWLQGITFSRVTRGAIKVKGNDFKVIDCVFENSQSPVAKSGAIVEISSVSSATVTDSKFINNEGGAIQNKGFLTVTHCDFIDNTSTPAWISNDETDERGGGAVSAVVFQIYFLPDCLIFLIRYNQGGAIFNSEGASLFVYSSNFVDNATDGNGPAIWSYTDTAIDLGGNCGTNNRIVHLQSEPEIVLGTCDGIYYKISNNETNLCATFGGECAM